MFVPIGLTLGACSGGLGSIPVMSIVGMSVIANWLWNQIRACGALLDTKPQMGSLGKSCGPWKASATIVRPIFMSGASVPDIVPLSYQWCLIYRSRT